MYFSPLGVPSMDDVHFTHHDSNYLTILQIPCKIS